MADVFWIDGDISFINGDVVWAGEFIVGSATGSIEFTATASAKVLKTAIAFASIEFTATTLAHNYNLAKTSGSIEFSATALGKNYNLAVASAPFGFTASTVAKNYNLAAASGSVEFTATAAGSIWNIALATGSYEFIATASAKVLKTFTASGSIEFVGEADGVLGYKYMTPAMHASLIDPQQGGAWLWLVQIKLPGYSIIRYARNTEDITYAGNVYTAHNFQNTIPKLTSDGSVARTTIKIAQDASYILENQINALEGRCVGGYVRLIRAHEDYLDNFIEELEYFSPILKAGSNWQWVTLKLGLSDPLRRVIPMRVLSSKMCPYAMPELFRGIECQYAGVDTTCTGLFEDCFTKGNAVHYGGELGLESRGA